MFRLNVTKISSKYPKLGFVIYLLCLQYFAVQVLVGSKWSNAYSISKNTISDLGNTKCGEYGSRYVCSPWHNLMNVSFVALGIATLLGSTLVYYSYQRTRKTALGFGAVALGGFGTILVGLFPENTISFIHVLGATLPFLVGNIGVVLLSFTLKQLHKGLRIFAFITGAVSLIALPFFASGNYLGLGQGGIERITAYPQTIFLIILGVYGLVTKVKD